MPVITFEAGQMKKEIKEKLIQQLTDVAVEITGIPKELYFISIYELPDEHIAIGGLTVTQLKANLAKKNAEAAES